MIPLQKPGSLPIRIIDIIKEARKRYIIKQHKGMRQGVTDRVTHDRTITPPVWAYLCEQTFDTL